MDVAALVDRRHVAGDEEAVPAELCRGLLRLAPVAAEDVRPLHLEHADGAGRQRLSVLVGDADLDAGQGKAHRSEEHTSELQSLMRISYAVFCLKKTKSI